MTIEERFAKHDEWFEKTQALITQILDRIKRLERIALTHSFDLEFNLEDDKDSEKILRELEERYKT